MFHSMTAEAAAIGAFHGRNSAEWFLQETIGGHSSGSDEATARSLLKGIEDGDPGVLDALPAPDLSGQWADGYLPQHLAEDCGLDDQQDIDEWSRLEILRDLCDAYEDAFHEAVIATVSDACLLVTLY